MKRYALILGAAIAVLLLSGCTGLQEKGLDAQIAYYKMIEARHVAQATAAKARADAQAQVDKEKYAARKAAADRLDAAAAERVLVAEAHADSIESVAKGRTGTAPAPKTAEPTIAPPVIPKHWGVELLLDGWREARATLKDLGPFALGWRQSDNQARVAMHLSDNDVEYERQRQEGETRRLTAPRAPTTQIDVDTGGGDAVVGDNNNLDRSDRRDCRSNGGQGGAGSPGGSNTIGSPTSNAASGFNFGGLTAGRGARGGRGGNAGGNCK